MSAAERMRRYRTRLRGAVTEPPAVTVPALCYGPFGGPPDKATRAAVRRRIAKLDALDEAERDAEIDELRAILLWQVTKGQR